MQPLGIYWIKKLYQWSCLYEISTLYSRKKTLLLSFIVYGWNSENVIWTVQSALLLQTAPQTSQAICTKAEHATSPWNLQQPFRFSSERCRLVFSHSFNNLMMFSVICRLLAPTRKRLTWSKVHVHFEGVKVRTWIPYATTWRLLNIKLDQCSNLYEISNLQFS